MWFDRVSIPTSILAFARLRAWFLVAIPVVYLISAAPAAAISLLRDADIEQGLTKISSPLLRAAGLNPNRLRVLVVNDSALNAFVVDGQTIFLNYGLILKLHRAPMVQAVIAHEAAHIANGHIARRVGNMRSARTAAGLGTLLALIAAGAGAGDAAGGIAIGAAGSAVRSFLAHTRAEEAAADRSAASFMTQAGVDPRGLIGVHRIFAGQEALSVGRQDPYMRSHPLSRDRIRAAEAFVATHADPPSVNPDDEYWFARVRGKLSAFTRAPKWTLRRISDEKYDDIRLMREAVAHHRNHQLGPALNAIDGAIALRPEDPFYYDLKGQILLENRKLDAAIVAYREAVALAPKNALLLGGYGRALLAAGNPKAALEPLENARSRDFRDARVLRDLALAYAKTGETGMAALTTAERYALQGRMKDALPQAQRATRLLPRGSAPWQRAQDVLIAAEQATKRKKR